MSATASNVTSLVMGLNPPAPKSPSTTPKQHFEEPSYARGRRAKSPPRSANYNGPYIERWANNVDKRNVSPTSTRSGKQLASSASSIASDNWRSSTNSAATSSSAFTRFSNGSVSTIATSVSSNSWRNTSKPTVVTPGGGRHHYVPSQPPPNVKLMTGMPWELDQLPRGMHLNSPEGADIFGAPPPARKQRARKPTDFKLDTISERPGMSPKPSRFDASTSTTDLGDFEGSPKKVQKGQINALAKMLSALRR